MSREPEARGPDFEVQPDRTLTRIRCEDDATNRIEVWSKGDGDCLFHSTAYLLRNVGVRGGGTQAALRAEVVGLLRTWFGTVAEPGAHREWIRTELVRNTEPGMDAATPQLLQTAVEAYFTRMARTGTYGDPVCVAAIEDLYNVKILTYKRDGAIILPTTNDTGAHTLRLAYVSYSGKGSPNHFNPLIPDTGQVIAAAPQLEAFEALDVPLGQLTLSGGARLYVPPIRHADFGALPARSGGVRAFFSNLVTENTVQTGGPIFGAFSLLWQPPKGSASSPPPPIMADACSPLTYSSSSSSTLLFRPRLIAPLIAGKGGLTQEVDGAALEIFLVLSGAYADTTPLELRLEARTGSTFVTRTLQFTWGDMGKDVTTGQGGSQRQCAIGTLDKADALLKGLPWKDSPYRLSIWSSAAGSRTTAAAVYFNVPALTDIVGLAQVADTPALRLGDFMQPLAALKIEGATIEALRDDSRRPKIPAATADLITAAFVRSGQLKRTLDPNVTSIALIQGGSLFLQTSWASFAVLRHDKGRYFVHWVGCAGGRDCFIATVSGEGKTASAELFSIPSFEVKAPNYFREMGYLEQQWLVFDFSVIKDLPPVSGAVTTGISSCAGGYTWPAKDADYVILWHFDANVSVVVPQIASLLWGKKIPDLRTIASIYPQPEEIRKYRNAILYPPEVAASSESRFLMRGTHLGSTRFATGCGQNEFGVSFEEGGPFLVGTYGFDKRTWTMPELSVKSPAAYFEHAVLDYAENVFEEYRHPKQAVETGKDLSAYSALRRGPLAPTQVVPQQKAGESVYKVPVAAAWTALGKAVTPLGTQPIFNIGLKGTWELDHSESPLFLEHPAPKKSEKKVEKKPDDAKVEKSSAS